MNLKETEEKPKCKCLGCAIIATITKDTPNGEAEKRRAAAGVVGQLLDNVVVTATSPTKDIREIATFVEESGWAATANGLRAYADAVDALNPIAAAVNEEAKEKNPKPLGDQEDALRGLIDAAKKLGAVVEVIR